MNQQWVMARQRLLRRVMHQVSYQTGENSLEIRKFKTRYEREFLGSWKASNPDRLLKKVNSSKVVLGGDFHAYHQSQRTHVRILRSLSPNKKVILGLECLHSQDQKVADLYIQGKISEGEFLERTSWKKKWGFPWVSYKPLFEIAQERGYKILALNKPNKNSGRPSTEARERHAARLIKAAHQSDPQALIYVIYGDFHLSAGQLPKKLGAKLTPVIIHQDSSRLYFRLARRKLENQVKVLEKSQRHFCVLTSPPWVKWQSYYFFLEGLGDSSLSTERVDWTEPVRQLFEIVSEELDLRMKGHDFSTYLYDDASTLKALKKTLPKKYWPYFRWHKSKGNSLFVPRGGLFVLASPSVNHAAGLFADYVHCRLTGRERMLWEMPGDFVPLIWVESLGFLVSKMINHRRKPQQIQSLLNQPSGATKEVLLLILEQDVDFLRFERGEHRRKKRFKPSRKTSYFAAARLLGGLLGERMYALYRSGKIDSKVVLDWLAKDVEDDDFDGFFEGIIKRLKFAPRWVQQQDMRL